MPTQLCVSEVELAGFNVPRCKNKKKKEKEKVLPMLLHYDMGDYGTI